MKNTSDADKFRLPKKSKSKVLFYTSNTGIEGLPVQLVLNTEIH